MKISVITPSHDPKYLNQTVESVLAQTYQDWEMIIMLNSGAKYKQPKDPRIKVMNIKGAALHGVGEVKYMAFQSATGEVLLELDHDDILTPDALEEVAKAFEDKKVMMAYSNFADFKDKSWEPVLFNQNYGWEYRDFEYQGHKLKEAVAWEPSPSMISLIFFAPNHLRAWRTSFYKEIGGHNPALDVCDDHELCIRTYLAGGQMKHIDKCLYLYRMYDGNTFQKRVQKIEDLTWELYNKYINDILLKWSKDNRLLAIDIGGRFNSPEGFTSVDLQDADINADLNKKWPFGDNSVGVIRAFDLLEHLPDKQHTMSEIHRVLAPGGWLLSFTPSTDGRGAFQDPTHVAFWNQNSFWYYTRAEQAQFIDNKSIRFMAMRNVTSYPSAWHQEHQIAYVTADLIKVVAGMPRLPGLLEI